MPNPRSKAAPDAVWKILSTWFYLIFIRPGTVLDSSAIDFWANHSHRFTPIQALPGCAPALTARTSAGSIGKRSILLTFPFFTGTFGCYTHFASCDWINPNDSLQDLD